MKHAFPVTDSRNHGFRNAVIAALFLVPGPVQAATITVDTVDDEFDILTGGNDQCSLREAIAAANSDGGADSCSAGSGDDRIVFAPALRGRTVVLDIDGAGEDDGLTGDLDIDDPDGETLTISGPTASDPGSIIIDGNDTDRVFHAFSALSLENLTVRNGRAPSSSRRGGGIFTDVYAVSVSLDHVRVSGNAASFAGGGIYVRSHNLDLRDSTVSDNTSDGEGGGVWYGVTAGGAFTMTGSTVSGNFADDHGGGMALNDGNIVLRNSTISGNTVNDDGGGLSTPVAGSVAVELNNVTVTDNDAAENGGGIFLNAGDVIVSNSIIAGNEAGTDGPDCSGGITSANYNLIGDDTGCGLAAMGGDLLDMSARLAPLSDNGGPARTHALIEDSPAVDAGDPNVPGGSGTCEIEDQRGESRPADGDGDGGGVCDIGAFEGTVAAASVGASGGGGGGGGGGAFGPLVLVLLGWLTCGVAAGCGRWCRPARGSPCVTTLGRCRTAAVAALFLAHGFVQAATLTVDTSDDELTDNDECSLREAVVNANNNDQSVSDDCPAGDAAPVVDEIVFDLSDFFLLNLGSSGEDNAMGGDLDILEDLRIVGTGGIDPLIERPADYEGNTRIVTSALLGDRVVDMPVPGVTLTLEELVIYGGRDVDDGAGIHSDWDSSVLTLRNVLVTDNEANVRGGGIYSQGGLNIENSAIFENAVRATDGSNTYGGGLSTAGPVTIAESAVYSNDVVTGTGAARGGGLYLVGSDPVAIRDSVIFGNDARTTDSGASLAAAAGAWVAAPADIERSTFVENTSEGAVGDSDASSAGLAVYESSTIANSTIAGNRALSDTGSAGVGGIGVHSGDVTLNNVTVTANTARSNSSSAGFPGGIYQTSGTVTLSNTIVANNSDSNGGYPDCRGTVGSDGYNILADNSGCSFAAAASDQVGDVAGGGTAIDPADVLLPGVAENGGGLMVGNGFIEQGTVRLTDDSLAVDAGDPNVPGDGGTCETEDQRGGERPADGDGDGSAVCDIGAFELGADLTGGVGGGGSGGGGGAPGPIWLLCIAGAGLLRSCRRDRSHFIEPGPPGSGRRECVDRGEQFGTRQRSVSG